MMSSYLSCCCERQDYHRLAIALLIAATYISHRQAKEEAQRHEYDRLRNTRPPDEN